MTAPQSPPDDVPAFADFEGALISPKSPPAGDELDEILVSLSKKLHDGGINHAEAKAKVNAYILAEILKLVENAPPHTERRYNYYEERPEYIPMVDKEDLINAAQARFGGKENV